MSFKCDADDVENEAGVVTEMLKKLCDKRSELIDLLNEQTSSISASSMISYVHFVGTPGSIMTLGDGSNWARYSTAVKAYAKDADPFIEMIKASAETAKQLDDVNDKIAKLKDMVAK